MLVLALGALASSRATAQADEDQPSALAEDETERARLLFGAGVDAIEAGDFAAAEEAFRRALALRAAPTVRYNLALALFELERFDEAARMARLTVEDSETDETIGQSARELLSQIESRAGRVSVTARGSTAGLELRVDALVVGEDGEVWVAPGARAVTAHREGREVAREQVDVEAGARAEVELTIAPSPEEVALAADEAGEASSGSEDLPEWFVPVVISSVAVVVVIATIIIIAAATAGDGVVQGDFEPGVLRWE